VLLRRFINVSQCGLALLVLCALLLAGCASGFGNNKGGMRIERSDVPSKALTLYEQAVASMAAGDSIDAELRFQDFLLSYPDYAGAHINLAIIFAGRGDDKAAEASLADALILDPQHPVALNQLGMLRRRQGKFPEAESAYLKAVTASPDYALAHYNLGVLNDLYLQRLDAALQHYGRYQELAGEDKQVSKWITDLTRRIGNAERTANVTE
jgi:tetratricopeptide (TPR) repeat protein